MMIYLLALFIISYSIAKLEVNIEGKNGWAGNLPTWRKNNLISKLFLDGAPLTGYHFWMFSTVFLIYQISMILFGEVSIKNELLLFSFLSFQWLLEDFLWFVVNPDYGIKKFNKRDIPWHKKWIGPVPQGYVRMSLYGMIFLAIYYYI